MKLFPLIKEMGDTEIPVPRSPTGPCTISYPIKMKSITGTWQCVHVCMHTCTHTLSSTLSKNSQFISEADLRHGWMSSSTPRSTILCAVHILHAGQGTFMVSE